MQFDIIAVKANCDNQDWANTAGIGGIRTLNAN